MSGGSTIGYTMASTPAYVATTTPSTANKGRNAWRLRISRYIAAIRPSTETPSGTLMCASPSRCA